MIHAKPEFDWSGWRVGGPPRRYTPREIAIVVFNSRVDYLNEAVRTTEK